MLEQETNRLKKICADIDAARVRLREAKKSAKRAATMTAKETVERTIKEVTMDLVRLESEQVSLTETVVP